MRDEGKYLQLWMKYLPVIQLLLKKTAKENQKLQLYKHEFENGGNKSKTGYAFSLEIINSKVTNRVNRIPVADDLIQILDNNLTVKTWLKENKVKFSLDKSFELRLEKIEPMS